MLKRERVRRRSYVTREAAKADVFDYIERFYNRRRRHGYLGYVSPVEFENQAMHADLINWSEKLGPNHISDPLRVYRDLG